MRRTEKADAQDAKPDAAIADYLMIDPTTVTQPFRNPAILRVRGRGARGTLRKLDHYPQLRPHVMCGRSDL